MQEKIGASIGVVVIGLVLLYFLPVVSPISLVVFYLVWTNSN